MRVFAPAKINLTLEVGWPYRETGRHPLQSVVVFADVGDWIEVSPSESLSLTVDGAFAGGLSAGEDNLVLRAARALAHAGGVEAGAALQLVKHLPVASGIGGGSADAAATLRALNQFWSLGYAEGDLMRIGATLGGDVPVCVAAKSAYMTGEGEIVTPIDLPPLDAVLVNPGVAAPTAAVFQRFDAIKGGAGFMPKPAPNWATLADVCAGIAERGNMLTIAARAVAPVIAEVEAALHVTVPHARCVGLSGSGATMFALYDSAQDAKAAAALLSIAHPNWWICPVRLAALDAPSRGG